MKPLSSLPVNPLRHLFLAVVLLVAQLAAGAHAVEHAAGKEGALPAHACELCLAAHDLGSVLPGVAALPSVAAVALVPECIVFAARSHLPPPRARQGAPPAA